MDSSILHNRDQVLITLTPTFSYMLDDDSDPLEIEYGDLPSEVQREVLEFFTSKEFIQEQAEGYALHSVTGDGCFSSYPGFDTQVNNVLFYLENKIVIVVLHGTLIEVPAEDLFQEKLKYMGSYVNQHKLLTCFVPVTISMYNENVKDGFHKASHSGPLTKKYGNHLGEDEGRYMIYLNYNRTQTHVFNFVDNDS